MKPYLPLQIIKLPIRVIVLILLLTIGSFSQLSGQTNTWDGSSSANWNTAANWSLNLVPTAAHDVVIPNGITSNITVNTAAVCKSFTISGGATANTVTIGTSNSLTVTNSISIGAGTGSGDNKILAVGAGSLVCGSINVAAAGSSNRISGVTLSTGTVTVSGNISMGDVNDDFTFTGAGTLNIGGDMSGGTFTPSSGRVNYIGTNQTIGNYSYNDLTLSNGGTKTYTVTTARTAIVLTVDNGVTLLLNGNSSLTPVNATINGMVSVQNTSSLVKGTGTITFNSGSAYEHARNGGTIPTATWNAASTCMITGVTSTVPTVAGFNQSFGNFTWNCTGQTLAISLSGNLKTINGDFSIISTGATPQILNLSVSGVDFITNILGDYIQSGGNLTLNGTSGVCTLNLAGNFNMSGGTLARGNGNGTFNFNGTSKQSFIKSAGTITGTIPFSVLSGAIVDFGNSVLDGTGPSFNLNASGTIITSHAQGLSTTGTTGSIQVTGTRTYSAGANYTYNGSVAQVTGNGLTGAANLTIDNAAGVTLSAAADVSGTLALTNGIVTSGSPNTLTVSNTSTSAITGGSASRFVNGPLIWQLATGQTYSYPIGKGTAYLPFGLTGIGGTAPEIKAEAFTGNSGGSVSGVLGLLSTTEYWQASVISGTYTTGSVSLTRQTALSGLDAIARSATQGGAYASLNGTMSGTSVNNSDATGNTLGYFVMAEKASITTGTIAPTSICSGTTITVPYTIKSKYSAGNVFTAQLSNSSGSFASPVNIGTVTSTTAGNISATIPAGTTSGTGYRIRVVSSTPSITGSDNGSNLTITTSLSAVAISPNSSQLICGTSAGTLLTVTETGGGTITGRQWGKRTSPGGPITAIAGATGQNYTPGTANLTSGTWYIVCTSTPACGSPIVSNEVVVTVSAIPNAPTVGSITQPGCTVATGSVQLTGLPASGTWTLTRNPGGTTTTGSGTSTIISGLGTGTHTFTVTNLYGCTSTSSSDVVINAQPSSPTITSTMSSSRCGSGTLTLSATASEGTVNWYSQETGGNLLATGNDFTTPNLTTSVIYYVEANNGVCISSSRVAVAATIITPPSITASGGGIFCPGSTVNLYSSSSDITNQYWTGPNTFYSLLPNPQLSNVTPSMSGIYRVTGSALSGFNLIINGDFEMGATGFTSDYARAAQTAAGLNPEGTYDIVAAPSSRHTNFCSCPDHTSNPGTLQMVINGASAEKIIWSQKVNVNHTTAYQFTYWVQTVVNGNDASPSKLQLYVNNQPAGPVYTANSTTGVWTQFTYNWVSGSGDNMANLELRNENFATSGNDFALDDIVFQQACEVYDEVTINVNDVTAGSISSSQIICSGNIPATLTSEVAASGSGTISYEWESDASGSYATIAGETSSSFTPPALTSTTSYRRRTVSNSGGITCYSGYTNVITITVNGPLATAGDPITVCWSASPAPITLSGASYSGGAISAAWSIISGGGSLSSSAQTTTPQFVTYTPEENYSGTVILRLTTSASPCRAIAERIININKPTVNISTMAITVCQNAPQPAITFSNPLNDPIVVTLDIPVMGGDYPITVPANSSVDVPVPTNNAMTIVASNIRVAYQNAPNCMQTLPGSITITITSPPSATISYGSPYCTSVTTAQAVTRTGTAGGSYTASPSGLSINAATGAITPSTSAPKTYTVTYNMAAGGGCSEQTAVTEVVILPDGSWTGDVDQDWNNPGNWACNQLPTLTTNVSIASGLPRYPIVSTEPAAMAKDISIASGASVTVTGGTLQIAGSISRSGTFTATDGTIEMKGSAAQIIGANVFATNTLKNLIVNNINGVTLQGPLNITGFVRPTIGTLNAGGYLTLLSSATQTALIEGVGTGDVTGIVNLQRYLPSSFGYKYFSSPFKSATVAELADEVNLTEAFTTLYKYDENHSRDSLGITVYYSGWTKYTTTTNPLVPMYGYAANLGTGTNPVTVTMSGIVNNGALQTSLFNNNRKYTKGFNLVGNPYPSPIDWDAAGWSKSYIDNAIYFFNAGNTDRYTGVYSSYVNGVSSGNADNIIAAMQGFFVHVSNGTTYPVSATLGVTNSVRVNNLNPVFKKAMIDTRPTLRLKAGFEIKNAIPDAAVIYFDPMASNGFEHDKDALKLNNTDSQVPNIYTLSPDGRELSINGLPLATDSLSSIPVGITTFQSGWINLRAENVKDLNLFEQVILKDGLTGQLHNLRLSPDIRFYLDKGKYDRRFSLLFTKGAVNGDPAAAQLFTMFRSGNSILVKVNLPSSTKGNLMVTNMLGQALFRKEVFEKETVEISQGAGVYVITLISGTKTKSEKILMRTDYE